jgi:ATP-dependent phosphofructokinase / diphosphate-dependent phosphofructokinase
MLTGGGDCPGLNAVIRAVVRKGVDAFGDELIGFRDGWRGPLEDVYEELTIESTRGILPRGGTILGSSRTNIFKRPDGVDQVRATFERHGLDGLIAIGGEDTLGAASRLYAEGLNVIGVPKTIDNDLGATDVTFTPPPRAITATSSSRLWGAAPDGLPCTPGWPAAPT